MTAEAVLTWKLFVFNWMLLAVMAAALALGVALTDFHVLPHGYLIVFAIAAVYGVLGYCNATSATRHNPRVCFILTAIAQMILVVAVMTSLTYVATAANLPLMDATLRAADVALGFDFRAYVDFVNDRPGLIYLLAAGYRSILWQICVIVVALPLLGHHRRAAEFICAFMLALIATTCISAVVPAIGAYNELNSLLPTFRISCRRATTIRCVMRRGCALARYALWTCSSLWAFCPSQASTRFRRCCMLGRSGRSVGSDPWRCSATAQ